MKISKRERTRKEILEAAKAIIHGRGHEAVTVRSLAEATGYAHTNLYYYFKDLNTLLWELRLHMIDDMVVELTDVPLSAENAVDEILTAFQAYTDYFYKHPNVFRFFYFYPFRQPEGDDSYRKLEHRFHGIWAVSFNRLMQEGAIEPEDLEIVAKTIIYALQGMILLGFSSNGAAKKEDTKDELAKLVNYLLKNR